MIAVLALIGCAVVSEPAPRWYAVPNFAIDTDNGVGFGARGELALDAPGREPYESAFVVHLFASTRGFHHHRFRYDRLGLGPGGRLRLTLHLAWRQWLNDGYWGIGNGTTRDAAYLGSFADDDPARKHYLYQLYQPFAHLTLRATLSGPWSLFSSLNLKWSAVRRYRESLLSVERPFGWQGGAAAILSAGLLFDTRSPEITPARGFFLELSGRYNPPLPHGAGSFGGVFAAARGYQQLGSRLAIAGRVMTEMLWGDIPFYEMVHWGGATPISGFGGADTLRGIAFGRFRAPGKAIANLELRAEVLTHAVFAETLRWQLVPYLDAGTVFAAGRFATSAAEAHWTVHPATGLGVRAIYQEAFVGRLDLGFGWDPIRRANGRVREAPTLGAYLVFDHLF